MYSNACCAYVLERSHVAEICGPFLAGTVSHCQIGSRGKVRASKLASGPCRRSHQLGATEASQRQVDFEDQLSALEPSKILDFLLQCETCSHIWMKRALRLLLSWKCRHMPLAGMMAAPASLHMSSRPGTCWPATLPSLKVKSLPNLHITVEELKRRQRRQSDAVEAAEAAFKAQPPRLGKARCFKCSAS